MIRISFTLVLLLLSVPAFAQDQNDRTSDRATITQLENQWLHAKDAATLERILGPDFVHVIAADHFLTKQEQIDWFGKHPQPAGRLAEFDKFQVRFYGDVAVVNGSVIAADGSGKELERTMFTDVFVLRNGRWQAVNGQENAARLR
jgi:hypothetical protein